MLKTWKMLFYGRALSQVSCFLYSDTRNSSVAYLIDVFALDAVSTIARWACATFPAAIRIASTLGTSKAGVGQAPI